MSMIKHIYWAAALSAASLSGANAQTPPELPGRMTGPVSKTIIFNVADENPERGGVFRASITCENGSRRVRKTTDRTGTATISFKFEVRPHVQPRYVECSIHKSGFTPAFERIDLPTVASPKMLRVQLRRM